MGIPVFPCGSSDKLEKVDEGAIPVPRRQWNSIIAAVSLFGEDEKCSLRNWINLDMLRQLCQDCRCKLSHCRRWLRLLRFRILWCKSRTLVGCLLLHVIRVGGRHNVLVNVWGTGKKVASKAGSREQCHLAATDTFWFLANAVLLLELLLRIEDDRESGCAVPFECQCRVASTVELVEGIFGTDAFMSLVIAILSLSKRCCTHRLQ
mmetsp:Transcript_26164/g.39765  ORF Transcript_26164/g.39765 Transcript_26164/m.39765 type:complete len:206 (+) Transcript_26164:56-673(+)